MSIGFFFVPVIAAKNFLLFFRKLLTSFSVCDIIIPTYEIGS